MKLLMGLFALVAAQGCVSAASIPDALAEADFSGLELFGGVLTSDIFDAFNAAETKNTPEKCLPYVQEAFDVASIVRRAIIEGRELGKRLKEGVKKCQVLPTEDERKQCMVDFARAMAAEGKPITKSFKKALPRAQRVMDKFDKCMVGEVEENPPSFKPEKCLPYIQEGYDTAVEVRRIITTGSQLVKKAKETSKKCKTITDAQEKERCNKQLQEIVQAAKPINKAYKTVRPKISAVMDKFDQCMAH